MNREEILEKSRIENKQEDEREKSLRKRSAIPGIITLGIVSLGIVFAELIFLDTEILLHSFGLLISAIACVQNWYIFIVIRKKFYVFTSLIFTLSTLLNLLHLINTFQDMIQG